MMMLVASVGILEVITYLFLL